MTAVAGSERVRRGVSASDVVTVGDFGFTVGRPAQLDVERRESVRDRFRRAWTEPIAGGDQQVAPFGSATTPNRICVAQQGLV